MGAVRVGTSGWQYDDWRPAFYPHGVGKARWFEHYAQAFPTVEINASFYRLPTERSVTRWHDQACARTRWRTSGSAPRRCRRTGPSGATWCTCGSTGADAVLGAGCDALVYFNNDVGAAALQDARCFTELLGDVAVPWP